MKILINLLLIFSLSCSSPEGQQGLVVKVIDGDTFDMKSGTEKIRVRLFGIDAPERGQAFNVKAKEFAASLIAGKEVRVVIHDTDRYGRTVADVYLSDGLHVNSEIVKAGFAWHFTRYSNDPHLADLQREAQQAGRGLWRDDNPIPPWEFRKRKQD
jgi:endonuclease YncB( thermonuclease family)